MHLARTSLYCFLAQCGEVVWTGKDWQGVAGVEPERLLRVDEVATRLGLKASTIRKMAGKGVLTVVRPTGKRAIRFRASEIAALIAGRPNSA